MAQCHQHVSATINIASHSSPASVTNIVQGFNLPQIVVEPLIERCMTTSDHRIRAIIRTTCEFNAIANAQVIAGRAPPMPVASDVCALRNGPDRLFPVLEESDRLLAVTPGYDVLPVASSQRLGWGKPHANHAILDLVQLRLDFQVQSESPRVC